MTISEKQASRAWPGTSIPWLRTINEANGACFADAVCLWLISLMPVAAVAAEHHVDQAKENRVMFVSESPLVDIDVEGGQIDGYAYWEGDGFPPENGQLNGSELYFEVPLNSLDGGNRHQ